MKTQKTKDRRVQKTHQHLHEALMALILEKNYDEITVQDILDRANVGRSTFYCHFSDKDELFYKSFVEFENHLMDQVGRTAPTRQLDPVKAFNFSLAFFIHASQYKEVFLAIMGNQSGLYLQRNSRQLIHKIVRKELLAQAPGQRENKALEPKVQFYAGAFYNILLWWIESKSTLSPQEIDKVFQDLCINGLTKLHS